MTAVRGFTWSEEHRHACEVRHVLAMREPALRREYLEGVAKRRGAEAAERLRADVLEAWHRRRAAEQGALRGA